jgi:predicted N-acyltransferase
MTLWRNDQLLSRLSITSEQLYGGTCSTGYKTQRPIRRTDWTTTPKALVAVPFTCARGRGCWRAVPRLAALVLKALIQHVRDEDLSSGHLLFAQPQDVTG